MKHYINRFMIVGGCALALAACDDNSWNDDLPGFEEPRPTDVQSLDYTLTAVDYKTLANNSANKALAGADLAKELAAVGSQGYFTDKITAAEYVPALLNDPNFQYFTLSDGSALKITYRVANEMPEAVKNAAAAQRYTVSDEDYQQVWGSENDYAASFAPSHTAASAIPGILKTQFADARAGDCVVVNYNTSSVDPVFSSTPTPPEPGFTLSNVLGSLTKGADITINGYVAAVSAQGPIVTDGAGSVFVYKPTNNAELKLGDQVVINSTVDSFNYGFQITQGSTPEVKGSQKVTNPTPKTWTGAEIDKFVADAMATGAAPFQPIYSKFTGKATVGNYINIVLDGTTVQLSPYGASDALKAMFHDGEEVTVEGYVMALASKGKFLNTIITKVGDTEVKALAAVGSRAVALASTNENATYTFDGSKWALLSGAVTLSHADYQAMGQRYDNFSGETPATLLPIYLKQTFPYAAAEDTKMVVYFYYTGSETVVRCDQYVFDGSAWVNNSVVTETAQFVRSNGKWNYDPSLTLTLPAGRGQELSTLYYQTCVDWVKANVPNGAEYVSSYGNNEYYCGTSAYQGNVDLRPGSARNQYPAGWEGYTDDEIVATEKARFEEEVMPAALAILHPDVKPVPGIDVIYTIHFYYYDGSTHPATVVYKVTAPATFTFVSSDWNE